jgi:uncharacterized protein (DUF2249 family)
MTSIRHLREGACIVPANTETRVDLRAVAPPSRLAVAMYTSCLLRPGQSMEVTDGRDPVDLQVEFQRKPETFGWEYLERGPKAWRVRIVRRQTRAETDTRTDAGQAVAA